jgi:hypothetical protein
MTRRNQYLAGVSMIALVWLLASIVLTLMLAGANDTMHPDVPAPVWLNVAFRVACPMNYLLSYLLPLDGLSGLLFWPVMIINSVIWGFLIVFSFRLVARLLKMRVVIL